MTRAILWIAVVLLSAAVAHAQVHTAPLAAGPAAIRGRLIHPEGAEAVRGAKVVLYAISSRGEPGVGETTADEDGRFAFEGLSNDPHTVYLVGAHQGEVPFGARVTFASGELEQQVEIALTETTAETAAVAVGGAQLRIERSCAQLRIRHSHALRNASDKVVYVSEADRASSAPLLRIELPENASGFEAGFGDQGVDLDGRTVRYWGPLHPGAQEIEFEYGIPIAETATLGIGFTSGAETVRVLSAREGVDVRGPGLSDASEVQDGEQVLLVREAGTLDPGASLALSLALSTVTPSNLIRTPDVRIVLELDDTALDIREQYQIQVTGDEAVPASPSQPLFCLTLPPGAENLRFSNTALEMGLSTGPSGALAVHGPIPAGESVMSIRYIVPVDSEPVDLERVFLTPLARLSVLVTDTGLVVETERLHSLRPLRTEDRSYLSYEGLSIQAGETVAVRLRHLSHRNEMSGVVGAGLMLLTAMGALVFLTAPLRSGAGASEARDEPVLTRAAIEREALMGSIRALDEDFETGKVNAEDHARMRAELRARAVALLREEREVPTPGASRSAAAQCPDCGVAARPEDQFCSQCGARLTTSDSEMREGEPR